MITKSNLESIPSTTGIYFFNKKNIPLYVGKAVNLKARLISHIRNSELDAKERAIIEQADSISFKTTLSEFDAILLEAHYIKKYRPKYNISWKDDKSYLYIKITMSDMYPKVFIVRAEDDGVSLYFGPFKSARIARFLASQIRKVVPFCTQKKITTSPCFYSKIDRCFPCPNLIEKNKKLGHTEEANRLYKMYKTNIKYIVNILSGKSNQAIKALHLELNSSSDAHDYESAIILRNRIELLHTLALRKSIDSMDLETNPASDMLFHTELKDVLSRLFKKNDDVISYRIECFDISNLTGTNATASMVVFNNSQSDKRQYRKFKIKTVSGISDFDMLKEVIGRRLKRTDWPLPNLLVVDGGSPQLRAISRLLKHNELDNTIPLIGIAKHPDRIIMGRAPFKRIMLVENSSLFKVLQAIRDESHRFAKAYHVLLRKRKLLI